MQHYRTTASVFCVLAILFPFVSSAQSGPFRRTEIQAGRTDLLLDTITEIHIYHVLDGENLRTVIPKDQLHSGSVTVDGYICGLVVFCDGGMSVQAAGRRFSRLKTHSDGSFSAKYFGRLAPGAVPSRVSDHTYFETSQTELPEKAADEILHTGYSLFPEVTGDAVSLRKTLGLALETADDRREIAIHQRGFEKSALKINHPETRPQAVYIGTRLARLRSEIPDFDARWAAIQKGISGVERQLGRPLISKVVLLDYAAIRNAISLEKSDDIWFYIETFREEPVPELETIAAHETIHKYVDHRRLTRSDALRKWFSDLKGHDLFSMERFLLLTQGMLPADAEASDTENSLFFAFIDERNFLKDRKGGHSRDNLDEFCTSFIHSALHIHRLKGNLHRRILLQDDTRRQLTGSEKKALLKTFQGTLSMFQEVLNGPSNADSSPDHRVFANGINIAAQVQIQPEMEVTTAALTQHRE